MKCWTRYMCVLPWIIAICLFLGSSFFRLDVAAATTDIESYDVYDVVSAVSESYPGGLFDYNLVFVRHSGEICLFSSTVPLIVYLENHTIRYPSSTSERFYWYSYVGNGKWVRNRSGSNPIVGSMSAFKSLVSSSYDVYDNYGILFFQGPPLLPPVLRPLNLMAVMEEILMVLPLLILFLTCLIGLRKGLKHILTFLRQA